MSDFVKLSASSVGFSNGCGDGAAMRVFVRRMLMGGSVLGTDFAGSLPSDDEFDDVLRFRRRLLRCDRGDRCFSERDFTRSEDPLLRFGEASLTAITGLTVVSIFATISPDSGSIVEAISLTDAISSGLGVMVLFFGDRLVRFFGDADFCFGD